MGFIDDERVVLLKKPVTLGLSEQNAVGHHLDKRRVAGLITEANLKTNGISKGTPNSSASRPATVLAATRRGWVCPMVP